MVREATVDAAVIYLGGNKGSKEEEKKGEATHFQEEKAKRLVSIIEAGQLEIVRACLL